MKIEHLQNHIKTLQKIRHILINGRSETTQQIIQKLKDEKSDVRIERLEKEVQRLYKEMKSFIQEVSKIVKGEAKYDYMDLARDFMEDFGDDINGVLRLINNFKENNDDLKKLITKKINLCDEDLQNVMSMTSNTVKEELKPFIESL